MDIFISYAREDLTRVKPLARVLESLGYSVWWDADLRAGRQFDKEIERKLAEARCVLVVWTKTSVDRQWVRAEAAEALDANKLVPVFLEPVKPPLYFRHVRGVDLSGWDGRADQGEFPRLLRDCTELVPAPAHHSLPEARETPGPDPTGSFRDPLKDGSAGPEMLWLPTGTYLMGSPTGDETAYDNERPQHEVRIAQPFAIGRDPVTFADYDRFCAAVGRALPEDRGWGRERRPVINVTWEDAVAYCLWLTEQTGQTYRLPSEAEWEYACRAGTQTRWSCGDGETALRDHAWFGGNAGGQTHPVGEKLPNPWGLHDLHGNVLEWVLDHWHDSYQCAPADGCAWEDSEGRGRVLRGGSWINIGGNCRSANRFAIEPGDCSVLIGFRLSREPSPPGRSG